MTKQTPPPIIRKIRSFVRREGRMTTAQRRALHTLWPRYGLDLQTTPYHFLHHFQREAPLCFEIGFGNGDTLLSNAQQHPEKNYIGVDVYHPGVGTLLLALEKKQVDNVRVFAQDAVDVLTQCVADETLAEIHIYFPDPWPKKRHHKRRLIQPAFVELLAKKLQPHGNVYIATDWQDYADHIQTIFNTATTLFSAVPTTCDQRPITKFEQRGLRLGHQIWNFVYQKQAL